MSWATFTINLPGGGTVGDGQVQFNWVLNAQQMLSGPLYYRHTDQGNGRILFEIDPLFPIQKNANGTYSISVQTYTPAVNIPPVPHKFLGGDYGKLTNIVFTPSATNPAGSGTITATFTKTGATGTGDDSCDWTAAVTTPLPAEVKKAGY